MMKSFNPLPYHGVVIRFINAKNDQFGNLHLNFKFPLGKKRYTYYAPKKIMDRLFIGAVVHINNDATGQNNDAVVVDNIAEADKDKMTPLLHVTSKNLSKYLTQKYTPEFGAAAKRQFTRQSYKAIKQFNRNHRNSNGTITFMPNPTQTRKD